MHVLARLLRDPQDLACERLLDCFSLPRTWSRHSCVKKKCAYRTQEAQWRRIFGAKLQERQHRILRSIAQRGLRAEIKRRIERGYCHFFQTPAQLDGAFRVLGLAGLLRRAPSAGTQQDSKSIALRIAILAGSRELIDRVCQQDGPFGMFLMHGLLVDLRRVTNFSRKVIQTWWYAAARLDPGRPPRVTIRNLGSGYRFFQECNRISYYPDLDETFKREVALSLGHA